MKRIEEIKERANNEEYVKHDIDYHEAQEDVQYLLSKLEIAEKALTSITGPLPQHHYCEWANNKRIEASQALQQIRS